MAASVAVGKRHVTTPPTARAGTPTASDGCRSTIAGASSANAIAHVPPAASGYQPSRHLRKHRVDVARSALPRQCGGSLEAGTAQPGTQVVVADDSQHRAADVLRGVRIEVQRGTGAGLRKRAAVAGSDRH